jgi:hypothetical protein
MKSTSKKQIKNFSLLFFSTKFFLFNSYKSKKNKKDNNRNKKKIKNIRKKSHKRKSSFAIKKESSNSKSCHRK